MTGLFAPLELGLDETLQSSISRAANLVKVQGEAAPFMYHVGATPLWLSLRRFA